MIRHYIWNRNLLCKFLFIGEFIISHNPLKINNSFKRINNWTIPHKVNERGIKWTICILGVKTKRRLTLITFAESVYAFGEWRATPLLHQARSGWISSVRKRVYLAFGRVYHQCRALYRRSFLTIPSLCSLHHYGVLIHAEAWWYAKKERKNRSFWWYTNV